MEVACVVFAVESNRLVIGVTDRSSHTNVTGIPDLLFWPATRQNRFQYRTLQEFLNPIEGGVRPVGRIIF
jgi:hypothetical protein